jgi:8-oxo-dGTP diphosphatase
MNAAPKFDYVCGFLFDDARKHVALIRKNRPEWQRGLLNGIGGKIETGEGALAAMRREFFEETGAQVFGWRCFCILTRASDWRVHFYVAFGDLLDLRDQTDEQVLITPLSHLQWARVVPGLRWQIALALEDTVSVEAEDTTPPVKAVA